MSGLAIRSHPRIVKLAKLAGALVGALLVGGVVDGWTAFGKAASGERRGRMEASSRWGDGGFDNALPLWNDIWGSRQAWASRVPTAADARAGDPGGGVSD